MQINFVSVFLQNILIVFLVLFNLIFMQEIFRFTCTNQLINIQKSFHHPKNWAVEDFAVLYYLLILLNFLPKRLATHFIFEIVHNTLYILRKRNFFFKFCELSVVSLSTFTLRQIWEKKLTMDLTSSWV